MIIVILYNKKSKVNYYHQGPQYSFDDCIKVGQEGGLTVHLGQTQSTFNIWTKAISIILKF